MSLVSNPGLDGMLIPSVTPAQILAFLQKWVSMLGSLADLITKIRYSVCLTQAWNLSGNHFYLI
jgi:hypothetical protein